MKVKKEFDYNPIKSFRLVNPFTMAFCYPYPLHEKSFIVKGGLNDVKKYVEKQKMPLIVHYSYWRHGHSRGIVRFIGFDKRYNFHVMKTVKGPYQLIMVDKGPEWNRQVLAEFKRVPRKWLKELNVYM
jgi:hypothetical protein